MNMHRMSQLQMEAVESMEFNGGEAAIYSVAVSSALISRGIARRIEPLNGGGARLGFSDEYLTWKVTQ